MGTNSVPIDTEILKSLEEFGFNIEYGQKCLESNKHNNITTSQFLTLQKRIRQGYKSTCDPQSELWNSDLIAIRPHSTIVNSIITKNRLEHIALLPRSQPRDTVGVRKQREQRDLSLPNKVHEYLPEVRNKTDSLEFKKYNNINIATQLNNTT